MRSFAFFCVCLGMALAAIGIIITIHGSAVWINFRLEVAANPGPADAFEALGVHFAAISEVTMGGILTATSLLLAIYSVDK